MNRKVYRNFLRFGIAPTGLMLACWQLKRHYWKQNLINNLEEALREDPKGLMALDNAEYNRRYRLDSVIIGECLKVGPKGIRFEDGMQMSNALVCACQSPQLGSFLVHLGWLPFKNPGPTQLTNHPKNLNVIREEDEPSGLFLKNNPEGGVWRAKDIGQLSGILDTKSIMFRALEPMVEGVRVKKIDLGSIPNRHLEYVFTWAGLSITALVFSFLL